MSGSHNFTNPKHSAKRGRSASAASSSGNGVAVNSTAATDSSDTGFVSSSPELVAKPDVDNNNDSGYGRGGVISETIKSADGINVTLESNLSYPVATNSSASQDDFVSLEKDVSSGTRLAQVLILGLLLHLLDVSLHLAIAGQYLGMRDCHRGVQHVFEDFSLSDLLSLNSSLEDGGGGGGLDNLDEAAVDLSEDPAGPLKSFITRQTYFKVRHKPISIVPEHWIEKAHRIVDFQLNKYGLGRAAEMCTFNGRRFDNALQAGAYVCRDGLTSRQQMAVADAFHGVSVADQETVVRAMLAGDHDALMLIVPRVLGADLTRASVEVAKKFTRDLTASDLAELRSFLEHEDVAPSLAPLMEAMSAVDPSHFEILGEAFSRVRSANVPKIEASFRKLNITFSSFLTDPSLFVRFLKDQEATEVLLGLQALLPTFGPRVLNSMLVVKSAFDETPGADALMDRVFSLPMGLLMKILSVRILSISFTRLEKYVADDGMWPYLIMGTASLGVVANLVTFVVYLHPECRKRGFTKLLLLLTAADFLYLTVMLTNLTLFDVLRVKMNYSYLRPPRLVSLCASSYATVSICVERYLVLSRPLLAKSRNYSSILCLATVLVAAVCLIPSWIIIFAFPGFRRTKHAALMDIYNSFLMEIVPFSAIVVFSCLIVATTRKADRLRRANTSKQQQHASSNKSSKVTAMILIIVLVFLVCHTLSLTQRIESVVDNFTDVEPILKRDFMHIVIPLTNWLLTVNSSVNFVIYAARDAQFRKVLAGYFNRVKGSRPSALTQGRTSQPCVTSATRT